MVNSIFLKEKHEGEIEVCTFPQMTSTVFVNTVCLAVNNVEVVHFQPEVKYFQELKKKILEWAALNQNKLNMNVLPGRHHL